MALSINCFELDYQFKSTEVMVKELQKRIGILPRICQPDESKQIATRPKSFAEICRIVRASRTMRFYVRSSGGKSADKESAIYGHPGLTVLLDLRYLRDAPLISSCYVRRKNQVGEEPGLRVLAGVPMKELINFMIHNYCQLGQSFDFDGPQSTVVGAVVIGKPGLAIDQDPFVGSCLGDEVICMRIVNAEGDLVEYSSDQELKYAVTNYGTLGTVYDVTFRFSSLSICRVNFEYVQMEQLMNNQYLSDLINANWITELIYIPMNSWEDEDPEWIPTKDLVLLRTAKQVDNKEQEPDEPLTSEPRFQVPIIDPIFGPSQEDYAENDLAKTRKLLKQCFEHQRRETHARPSIRQFTPWALNATVDIPHEVKIFQISVPVPLNLANFAEVLQAILNVLKKSIQTFPLNVGMKVHFTRQHLQDLNDPLECKNLLVHFKLLTLSSFAENEAQAWHSFTESILTSVQNISDKLLISWNSDWPSEEIMVKNYQNAFNDGCREKLKFVCNVVDRDGMFLNGILEKIVSPKLNGYQQIYRSKNKWSDE